MTKQHIINAYAYRISIPAIDTVRNLATDEYYNSDLFEGFLNEILNQKLNKSIEKGKYMHLVSIKPSLDSSVLEGTFHTTKYGQQSDIIDITNDAVVNQLKPGHGVKNIVNFVIHRKSGFLLIQNDPFRVISRNNLIDFLEKRKHIAEKYVTDFNNNCKPLLISKDNFYTIQTIYDEDFYKQLAKLMNIKAVSINTKVEKSDVNAALSKFTLLDSNEESYLDEITDVTYTFKNTFRGHGVKHVKHFIKNALDMEKIDTITAHGSNQENVSFGKVKARKYPISTTINEHGVLDQSKIIDGMIKIAKEFTE